MLGVNSLGRWDGDASTGSSCDMLKKALSCFERDFSCSKNHRRMPVQLQKIQIPLKVKANRCCKQGERKPRLKRVTTYSFSCQLDLGEFLPKRLCWDAGPHSSLLLKHHATWALAPRAAQGEGLLHSAGVPQGTNVKEGSGSQHMKSEKWQRFALEAAAWGYLRTMSGSTSWLLRALKKPQLMGAPPKQTRYPFYHAVPVEKSVILH